MKNEKQIWISVKDRLPEKGQVIFTHHTTTITGGGEKNVSEQYLVQRYNGSFVTDSCEQHRMDGILFDVVSKTDYWMPIPELPKGE